MPETQNPEWLNVGSEVVIVDMPFGEIIRFVGRDRITESAPGRVTVYGYVFARHFPKPNEGALIIDAEKWLSGSWRLLRIDDPRIDAYHLRQETNRRFELVKHQMDSAAMCLPHDLDGARKHARQALATLTNLVDALEAK